MRVSEDRVLRRKFGPKKDEGVRRWRRLHSEELHNLYASPNDIRSVNSRKTRCAEYVACMEKMRNAYKILFGKS
jgi:hypothetical protein